MKDSIVENWDYNPDDTKSPSLPETIQQFKKLTEITIEPLVTRVMSQKCFEELTGLEISWVTE